MARTKRGVTSKAKHKKVLKAVKGQWGRRKNTIRVAKQSMEKAMQYAYRDRRTNKRNFRRLWIIRINAAVRQHGLSYSKFISAMKDKNIDAFICYGEDRWNLELSSGMERFVSSLAIRIGLINVSTLPRPNFIIVDEGFGALDSDNIANMEGAFNYMKTQFDFVMIITHLDTIKDYMDALIPINVNNGLSKVIYS